MRLPPADIDIEKRRIFLCQSKYKNMCRKILPIKTLPNLKEGGG
jgi:hypothetical protein